MFIHCLLKANWKDEKYEGVDISRGSFITGRKKLSKELSMTEQEIRTALKHLVSTNEITIKKTNKYSIISIKNYENYQQVTSKLTINQPASNQQELENCENLTSKLTNKNNEESIENKGQIECDIDTTNQVSNQQLTNKNQKNSENQPLYIDNRIEYKTINNSVCNAHVREDFNCQLGKKFKGYACKDCMKKYKCPIADDPSFKMIFGRTFYEQMEHEEKIRKERADEFERKRQELSNMPKLSEEQLKELNDYDWINEESEE